MHSTLSKPLMHQEKIITLQMVHPKIIIKRDGCRIPFDPKFIAMAVNKAAQAVGVTDPSYGAQIAQQVSTRLAQTDPEAVDIAMVQHTVEEYLMMSPNKAIARAYIEYRHDRDVAREKRSRLSQSIQGLLQQTDAEILSENANKDSRVLPTQRDLLAGIVARHYALRYLLPPHIARAHECGALHYHDLDYAPFFPMFNCMLIDLEGMLTKGFQLGNVEIESPKSIGTATAVTAQIIAQVASHIYGGTTIHRIDEILAPYVRKSYEKHLEVARLWKIEECVQYAESRTKKECFDAFQGLEYEINTLHTSNGQTPFVTFGFGLGTSWESRLIQESILQNRINGLGRHQKTAVFPKLVFTLKSGVNLRPRDPNYDIKQKALLCSAKRMYPDILNYEQVVEVTGSFKTPMGCRSFLAPYRDETGHEVLAGRNNLGVVSINLPRIALEAQRDETRFYQILNERLLLAKEALMTRIARFEGVTAKIAPILYMHGACGVRLKENEPISNLFKSGRASISLGYIGIHETVMALYGDTRNHIYDSAEQQEKAVAIVRHLHEATVAWKAETGYGFSLYATPSEKLCHRFCQLDNQQFGCIPGITDKGYYTNSFHLDVEKKVSPFEKILFEQAYPKWSSGGFICYGEYPPIEHNLQALEEVWDFSYTRVPYYGTNIPIDACYQCGFRGEFLCTSKGFACPECNNRNAKTISVTRRVCGYLGNPESRPFNPGKQAEVSRRIKHLASPAANKEGKTETA